MYKRLGKKIENMKLLKYHKNPKIQKFSESQIREPKIRRKKSFTFTRDLKIDFEYDWEFMGDSLTGSRKCRSFLARFFRPLGKFVSAHFFLVLYF